jgi:hypothetical protein
MVLISAEMLSFKSCLFVCLHTPCPSVNPREKIRADKVRGFWGPHPFRDDVIEEEALSQFLNPAENNPV